MTRKQNKTTTQTEATQLTDDQLDDVSGGPTAVENVTLNFTKVSSSLSTNTTIGTKTITSP